MTRMHGWKDNTIVIVPGGNVNPADVGEAVRGTVVTARVVDGCELAVPGEVEVVGAGDGVGGAVGAGVGGGVGAGFTFSV